MGGNHHLYFFNIFLISHLEEPPIVLLGLVFITYPIPTTSMDYVYGVESRKTYSAVDPEIIGRDMGTFLQNQN